MITNFGSDGHFVYGVSVIGVVQKIVVSHSRTVDSKRNTNLKDLNEQEVGLWEVPLSLVPVSQTVPTNDGGQYFF